MNSKVENDAHGRNNKMKSSASTTATSKDWRIVQMGVRLPNFTKHPCFAMTLILKMLLKHSIVPYHLIHIEHCENCENHQLNTRHVPGTYEKMFEDVKLKLKQSLPPLLVYSNYSNRHLDLPEHNPRLGSFEILVRPYDKQETFLMFSKLRSKCFPDPIKLIDELAYLFIPNIEEFGKREREKALRDEVVFQEFNHLPSIELLVTDACTKAPIDRAKVTVYRVNTSLHSGSKNLEDPYAVDSDASSSEDDSGVASMASHATSLSIVDDTQGSPPKIASARSSLSKSRRQSFDEDAESHVIQPRRSSELLESYQEEKLTDDEKASRINDPDLKNKERSASPHPSDRKVSVIVNAMSKLDSKHNHRTSSRPPSRPSMLALTKTRAVSVFNNDMIDWEVPNGQLVNRPSPLVTLKHSEAYAKVRGWSKGTTTKSAQLSRIHFYALRLSYPFEYSFAS
jgi:hypothetical protein